MKADDKTLKQLGIDFYETRDERDFNALFIKLKMGLTKRIENIVKDRDVAEDIYSQIMTKVYNEIEKYNPDYNISTWIYKIADSYALGHLRKQKRSKTVLFTQLESNTEDSSFNDRMQYKSMEMIREPEKEKDKEEESEADVRKLMEVFNSLDEIYRDVMIEAFINDCKYKEISEKFDIPVHTVRNRISRGRTLVKRIYAEK